MAWLDPWDFRRPVTVDNSAGSAKTNYAVKVVATGLSGDGDDVRFTDSDETTVLSHWIESWADGVLWVKVPSIPAASSKTIYLYYGNNAASSTSDISSTFTFGEDFDDPDSLTAAAEALTTPCLGNTQRHPVVFNTDASDTWRSVGFDEQSKIIYDPDDSDASRRYKFYVGGRNEVAIGAAFSPDGINWTPYAGNPILVDDAHGDKDDPDWAFDGTTQHLYIEDGTDVGRYTSTDGSTWTWEGIAIPIGGSGQWDNTRRASPTTKRIDATHWVMIYQAGTGEAVGSATSSDGITWTKNPNNPLWEFPVNHMAPADLWQDDSGDWWLVFQEGANDANTWLYKTTEQDPELWVPASWTQIRLLGNVGDYTLVENTGRKSGVVLWGQSANPSINRVCRCDVLGTSTYTFQRRRADANPKINANPLWSFIEVHNDILKLAPRVQTGTGTSSFALLLRIDGLNLTNNFAVGFRMRKVAQTDELHTRISIGSGSTVDADALRERSTFNNGYCIQFGRGNETSTRLQKITAGISSILGSLVSIPSADFVNFRGWELRYLSSGALSVVLGDAVKISATDTAFVADLKQIMLTQGMSASAGASVEFDAVYARPYDGVDPTQSVGSLEISPSAPMFAPFSLYDAVERPGWWDATERPTRMRETIFVREDRPVALTEVQFGPYTQGEIPEALLVRVLRPLRAGSTAPLEVFNQTPAYTATVHIEAPNETSTSRAAEIMDPADLPVDYPLDFSSAEEGWVRVIWQNGDFDQVGTYRVQIVLDNGVVRLKSTDIWLPELNLGPAAAVGA
jgi:hypothetical protein